MNIQNVTLIGGPADGQRHSIDVELHRTYAVAVLHDGDREVRFFEERKGSELMHVHCRKHIYFIRQVGHHAWAGVHRDIA
ncbi:hypothetical protein [Xanthomonas cannabis]|uniref:hypothetical protein n=1 Tax=Xanthomonas cannabis TaxID=1885674 RepID=UPI0033B93092